mgnify:CR=1 FL=1
MNMTDTVADQARHDRRRLLRAFNASLGFVLLLVAVFAIQPHVDWRGWAVSPLVASGLPGLLGAPLLHGSLSHLVANASALLLLGTLAGSVYPRATLRALPLMWLGSGLGAWLLGAQGSHHLGASGVTHGLMLLVFVLPAALSRFGFSGIVERFYAPAGLLCLLIVFLPLCFRRRSGGQVFS